MSCSKCGSLTKGVHAAGCKSNPYLTFATERGLDYGVVLRASETLRHNWPEQLPSLTNSDLQALKVVDRIERERRYVNA